MLLSVPMRIAFLRGHVARLVALGQASSSTTEDEIRQRIVQVSVDLSRLHAPPK